MQEYLQKALDFSNYQHTLSIQRKALKEKIESNLTFGHNGGLFQINQTLITFVQLLIDKGRIVDVVLLDKNNNPILISNLESFQEEIMDRYFSSVNEYFNEYQSIKKSRSVEKLIQS